MHFQVFIIVLSFAVSIKYYTIFYSGFSPVGKANASLLEDCCIVALRNVNAFLWTLLFTGFTWGQLCHVTSLVGQ